MVDSFPASVDAFVAKAKGVVDAAGIKSLPIRPELLAKSQGIQRIVLSTSLQFSGQLVRDHGDLVIKLNANEPLERRNFSCCHEIAHAFSLRGASQKSRVASETFACSPASREEYLCDRAASEMLMPEKFFKPSAADLQPSIDSVVCLSKTFASSISATIIRLGQLAVWPVLFIVWKFAGRPASSHKLRVFWSVRPAGYRCFIPCHVPADPSSGMYATFTTAHPTCEPESLNLGSLRGQYLVENRRFGDFVVSIVHDVKLPRRG